MNIPISIMVVLLSSGIATVVALQAWILLELICLKTRLAALAQSLKDCQFIHHIKPES